jgi:hypothetical protein
MERLALRILATLMLNAFSHHGHPMSCKPRRPAFGDIVIVRRRPLLQTAADERSLVRSQEDETESSIGRNATKASRCCLAPVA